MSFKIHPDYKAQTDHHLRRVEEYCRSVFDPAHDLKEWQLFQQAFVEGAIDFATFFVATMSGIYFGSPKVIDNIRSIT
jgi:hypothetical protein